MTRWHECPTCGLVYLHVDGARAEHLEQRVGPPQGLTRRRCRGCVVWLVAEAACAVVAVLALAGAGIASVR